MNARALFVILLALSPAACRRRRPVVHPYTGPALGSSRAQLVEGRALDAPLLAVQAPFDQVVLTASRVVGLAGGQVFTLPRSARAVGGEPAPMADVVHEGERVRSLVRAGGDRVYALLDGSTVALARSDDGGAHWVRGASLGAGPLPAPVTRAEMAHPELTPALAAWGDVVVYWFLRDAVLSRDAGLTFAAVETGGTVRSAAITGQGTLLALVRSDPPPEDEPMLLLRSPAQGPATRTVLEHRDPCTAGALFTGDPGRVFLGGGLQYSQSSTLPVLGLCAMDGAADGATFAPHPLAAGTLDARLSPSGAALVLRSGTLERSGSGSLPSLPLPAFVREQAADLDPSGALALGLTDALVYLPTTDAEQLAWLESQWRAHDRRGAHALAAAQGWLASLDGRGTVHWVTADARGEPEEHSAASPCRFDASTAVEPTLPLLTVDARGRLCCATPPGRYNVPEGAPTAACATLTDVPLRWEPLEGAPTLLRAGEDGLVQQGAGGAQCVPAQGPAFSLRERMHIPPGVLVQDASCGARRTLAVVRESSGGRAALGASLLGPWQLRDDAGRTLLRGQGLGERVYARRDGSAVVLWTDGTTVRVGVVAAGGRLGARASVPWHGEGNPGSIAPWDAHTALVTTPLALAVAGAAGVRVRSFGPSVHVQAVARVGERLLGATQQGRFVELRVQEP